MSDEKRDRPSPPGGRAAERLREFLRGRLPAGATPDELNPALENKKEDDAGQESKSSRGGPGDDDRDADERGKP
jgi:hypothetical protein